MEPIMMRALMSLEATATRPAQERGAQFETSAQDARDLEQMGRAERVAPERKRRARSGE